jgi:CRISPR system Cascade subunit CasE
MHRSLMRAFPDDLKAGTERVLFRLEIQDRGAMPTLLVQSWTLPDWSWLGAEARGYLLPTSVPNPAIKSFDMQAASEQELAFRLRANPSVKRDGRRCGLYCWDEQRQWLTRKGEQGGFRVLSVQPVGWTMLTDYVCRDKGITHKLTLLAVQFDGLLQVTDPDHLRESVEGGIGSAKAFGLGLLSLAPLA